MFITLKRPSTRLAIHIFTCTFIFSVRVFPSRHFHTAGVSRHGWSWTPSMSLMKLSSWARRAKHHLRSVTILIFILKYYVFLSIKLTRFCFIGVTLRDSHGVAQVRFVTGKKILRIMKANGQAPNLPEDLYYLIKKAVAIRKHLERNRKDKDNKFRLILVESRIHRLARYYKTKSVLPPNWKYESSTASALVA